MKLQKLLIALVLVVVSIAQQVFNPWEGLRIFQQFPTQPPYYIDHYKSYGYETDEKGNVWTGNDNAKFMIFARSSYP